MAQPRGTYNRFRIEEDMWLCEEVLKANPFIRDQKADAWLQIVENLNAIPIFGKPTGERACKHRLEDLLLQYRSGDMAKLRRSGSEEQFQILQELITQVIQLKEANLYDEEEEVEMSVEKVVAKKPVKEKTPGASSKRPFLVSMAQPTEIQRHIQMAEIPTMAKKPRLLPAPAPVAPPPAKAAPVTVTQYAGPPSLKASVKPAVSNSLVKASVSSSDSHSDNNYVSFLIEQNSRQNDLREKELQQTKDIREKELELDRARLDFEERKWEHQLALLQQQQDMMREMLVQQAEQQKLIFGFLKQLQETSSNSPKSE